MGMGQHSEINKLTAENALNHSKLKSSNKQILLVIK